MRRITMLSEIKIWIMESTFGPARQQRRVGRAEGRTLGKRDEEIIDKARPPARACKLGALIVRDLHLREKKTGAAELLLLVPHGWPAAIESPIPERENQHVGQPEQCARAQKFERRFFV